MEIVQSFILKLKDHTAEALAQLKPLTVTAWWLVDTVDSSGLTSASNIDLSVQRLPTIDLASCRAAAILSRRR